ncbi:MAG: hypothetical protein CMB45_05285 [Euryarchaeota archaeon]|nr:hypothetical protein [Euryarchaeota archaeon]MBK38386.1 hypothetical protein [Euryarchaeota archaeon]|tara:strand:- start:5997 stop:8030 length:2034 start_codon:yes stop_codon:yes gene_type:complete
MQFTDSLGEVVTVPDSEVNVLENGHGYTVYGARKNPGGEMMMSVVRSNHNMPGRTVPPADLLEDYDKEDIGDNQDVVAGSIDTAEDNIRNNPAQLFTWKNLRLQTAISGGKAARGFLSRAGSAIVSPVTAPLSFTRRSIRREISPNQSIRDNDSLLKLATAEDWFRYIKSLKSSPVDMGAEYSTMVSKASQASVYLFLDERRKDPSLNAFRRRLTPGSDVQDAMAKAQIVEDIMLSAGPSELAAPSGQYIHDKMFRLAMDIIKSIPMNSYNYYTVNEIHVHEGDQVFADLRKRYLPLEVTEVEMVLEMQQKLAEEGEAYAFSTTTNTSRALDAATLMKTAVAAYEVGDTRTVRTAIMTLRDSPFNYQPKSDLVARVAGGKTKENFDGMMEVNLPILKMDSIQKDPRLSRSFKLSKASANNNPALAVVVAAGIKKSMLKQGGIHNELDYAKGPEMIAILKSTLDPTPIAMGIKTTDGKKKGYAVKPYDEVAMLAGRRADKPAVQKVAKDLGKEVKRNPKGRGKFLHIEIHPKTQLEMKRRGPGTKKGVKTPGETRHGNKSKKRISYWTRGLSKFFPGMQMLQVGTHKKTGEEVPYRIRLPISHFAKVTHPSTGFQTISLKKGKDNKALVNAFRRMGEYYGIPRHNKSKDTYMRFTIAKGHQGEYYDKHRVKVGKAKKA